MEHYNCLTLQGAQELNLESHNFHICIVHTAVLRSIIIARLCREHPVQEGLDRVAMYNMSMLQVYNYIQKYMIGYIYIEIYV